MELITTDDAILESEAKLAGTRALIDKRNLKSEIEYLKLQFPVRGCGSGWEQLTAHLAMAPRSIRFKEM